MGRRGVRRVVVGAAMRQGGVERVVVVVGEGMEEETVVVTAGAVEGVEGEFLLVSMYWHTSSDIFSAPDCQCEVLRHCGPEIDGRQGWW